MKRVLLVFLVLFGLALSLRAQQDYNGTLPTDRPGNTYNATTLQAGVWQLQTGVEWGSLYEIGYGQGYDVLTIPTDIRYGITDRFEVMFSPKFNFATVAGTGGGIEYSLSAYSLLGRFNFFDGEAYGSMAVLGGYQYTTYEGGIANGNSGILKILYKVPLGDRFQIASNLGYSLHNVMRTDNTSETNGQVDYTLNASFSFNPQFGIYVETFGSFADNSITWFDAGLFWLPNSNLQVDLFYATGNGDAVLDYYTALGLSYRFGTPR